MFTFRQPIRQNQRETSELDDKLSEIIHNAAQGIKKTETMEEQ